MKPYLVSGHIVFHTPGQFLPVKGTALLEDDEVMDPPTLAKVEAILLHEHNTLGKMAVAKAIVLHSFQPYEPLPVTEPVVLPHLNECAVVLPPVGSPLLIEIAPGVLVRASRPSHAPTRDDYLRFDIEGNTDGWYVGRPRWTHP